MSRQNFTLCLLLSLLFGCGLFKVYAFTPDGYLGCYVDDYSRILPDKYFEFTYNNTGDLCKNTCADAGFRYAGTEYNYQCYCGNTVGNISKADGCNWTCPGNINEKCGGFWRISIYDTQAEVRHFPQDTSTYFDEVAETFCIANSHGFVFTMKRSCADVKTCNRICESTRDDAVNFFKDKVTQTTCFDALYIYQNVTSNRDVKQDKESQPGVISYGYGLGGCSWGDNHCGPNYCCCRAN